MYLRNEFDFLECSWNREYFESYHEYFRSLETRSIYDSMNIQNIEFIT